MFSISWKLSIGHNSIQFNMNEHDTRARSYNNNKANNNFERIWIIREKAESRLKEMNEKQRKKHNKQLTKFNLRLQFSHVKRRTLHRIHTESICHERNAHAWWNGFSNSTASHIVTVEHVRFGRRNRCVACVSLSRFAFFFIVFHLMLWNGFHGQSIRKLSNLTFTLMALICIINTTSFNIDCRHCERCEQWKYHRMSNIAATIEMRPLHSIFVHLSALPPSLLSLSSNLSIALHHFRLPPNAWRKEISISKQILPRINSPIHLRITIFFRYGKKEENEKIAFSWALKQVQHYVLSFFLYFLPFYSISA